MRSWRAQDLRFKCTAVTLQGMSSKLLAIWVGRFMQGPALETLSEILLAVIKMDEAVQGKKTEKSREPGQVLEKD